MADSKRPINPPSSQHWAVQFAKLTLETSNAPIALEEMTLPFLHPQWNRNDLKNGALLTREQADFVVKWFDDHPDKIICKALKNKNGELGDKKSLGAKYNVLYHKESRTYWVVYKGIKSKKHVGTGAQAVVKLTQNMLTLEHKMIKAPMKNSNEGAMYNNKTIIIEHAMLNKAKYPALLITNKHYHRKYLIADLIEGMDEFDCIEGDFLAKKNVGDGLQLVINLLLEAINRLQKNGILHRDLKPENTLINLRTLAVKIIDFAFGIAKEDMQLKTNEAVKICGSLEYVHPDVWHGREAYSEQSDNYGLLACIAGICNTLQLIEGEKCFNIRIFSNTPPFMINNVALTLKRWTTCPVGQIPSLNTLLETFLDIRQQYVASLAPEQAADQMNNVGFLSVSEYLNATNEEKEDFKWMLTQCTRIILINTEPKKNTFTEMLALRKELEGFRRDFNIVLDTRVITCKDKTATIAAIVAALPAYLEKSSPSPLTSYAWITQKKNTIHREDIFHFEPFSQSVEDYFSYKQKRVGILMDSMRTQPAQKPGAVVTSCRPIK